MVAEVKHGRLQSGSSLAKGVQSGERLAGKWSQALEYCARAGAVDGQGRASHALGGGLEDELRGEALLNVVPGEPALGLDGGDDEDALRLGPAEKADRTAADDLPAGALREAAAVGLIVRTPATGGQVLRFKAVPRLRGGWPGSRLGSVPGWDYHDFGANSGVCAFPR